MNWGDPEIVKAYQKGVWVGIIICLIAEGGIAILTCTILVTY